MEADAPRLYDDLLNIMIDDAAAINATFALCVESTFRDGLRSYFRW